MPAPRAQLMKVGFSFKEADALHKMATYAARTTVRVASAAGATVLPVVSLTNLIVGDTVMVARGTAVAEQRRITAITATAGAESVTVGAMRYPHAVGQAVEEITTEARPSLRAMEQAGFPAKQALLLFGGNLDLDKLIRQGKFTRAQAQLILKV